MYGQAFCAPCILFLVFRCKPCVGSFFSPLSYVEIVTVMLRVLRVCGDTGVQLGSHGVSYMLSVGGSTRVARLLVKLRFVAFTTCIPSAPPLLL